MGFNGFEPKSHLPYGIAMLTANEPLGEPMGPRIGDLLVQTGVITEVQLDEALIGQTEHGRRLASELLALGYANERSVCEAMSESMGHPVLVLSESTLNLTPLEWIPEAVAKAHPFLPVAIDEETVTIAVADLQGSHVLDQVAYATARRVTPLLIPQELLEDGLRKAYDARRKHQSVFRGANAKSETPHLEVARGISPKEESDFSDLLSDLNETYTGLVGQDIPAQVAEADPFALPLTEPATEPSFAEMGFEELGEPTAILEVTEDALEITEEESTAHEWEGSSGGYMMMKPAPIPEVTPQLTPAFGVESLTELAPTLEYEPERGHESKHGQKPAQKRSASGTALGRVALKQVPSQEAEPIAETSFPTIPSSPIQALPSGIVKQPANAMVLVVEDDPTIRELIRRALSFDHHHIVEAATGDAAVNLLRQMRPHVVVLDAMLPGVHGFEICAKIKSSSTFAGTKVVMVSAVYRGWEQAREIQEVHGADAFLEKPFEVQLLRKMVAELTGKELNRLQLPADQQANIENLSHQARSCAAVRAFDDALRHADAWVACDPFDPDAHLMRGNIFTAMGDYPRALVPFEAAAVYGPRIPEALLNLALTYDRLGFRRRALESYSRARRVTTDPAVQARLDERLRQG